MAHDAGVSNPEVGGDGWPPLFAKFYLRASEMLVSSASTETLLADVVLPILYLQRHCLELIAKDLILACFHIDEADEIAGKKRAGIKPPKFDHDLPALIRTVEANLNDVGQGGGPEVQLLHDLAQEFAGFEMGSPERFRYAYVERFINGEAPPTGFPAKVEIPIRALQVKLEECYRRCSDLDDEPASLWRLLYDEAGRRFQSAIDTGRVRIEPEST